MDTPRRDELRERRREEALARRMGEALDRLSPQGAGECPDAEVIAAYHERALVPEESAQWEGHFAGCSRCRKILAVLSASVEEPLSESEVAHLGELVASTARSYQGAPSRSVKQIRPNRWDWRVRWLAPALGVAAALAVWFAMRPPWHATSPESSGTLIAQAPKNEPQQGTELRSPDQPSNATREKNEEASSAHANDQLAPRAQSFNPQHTPLAANSAGVGNAASEIRPTARAPEETLRDEKKQQDESNGLAASQPPSPTPQAQAQPAVGASNAVEASRSTSQSVVVTGEAPLVSTTQSALGAQRAPQSASDLPLKGKNVRELSLSKAGVATPVAVEVRTPSGTVLWRAGNDGSIQRSSDAGSTWISQDSPLREGWLAGSAVSDTGCWLVGRNGAIGRTIDGHHWEKIAPPPLAADASGKLPDWVAVTAQNAGVATITARDQRRYATQDGGKTWQAQ